MKIFQSIRSSTIIFGVFLSLLFILGCSELPNMPVSGEFTIADFEHLIANDKAADPADFEEPELPPNVNITALSGGIVEIPLGRAEKATFNVPPNSVASDVSISAKVKKLRVPDKTVLEFIFGPSGLVFNKDATLEINVSVFRDSDMTYLNWYWYNPDNGKWELEEVVPVKDGKVEIPVSHFSRYVGISQGGQQ